MPDRSVADVVLEHATVAERATLKPRPARVNAGDRPRNSPHGRCYTRRAERIPGAQGTR